jgi:membrane protein implicated in regulation of membrane protease activity
VELLFWLVVAVVVIAVGIALAPFILPFLGWGLAIVAVLFVIGVVMAFLQSIVDRLISGGDTLSRYIDRSWQLLIRKVRLIRDRRENPP